MGADKAFVELDGRPLIAHAIERLRPQVDALAISANGDPARFAPFASPILADAAPHRDAGPLAGIAAALGFAGKEGFSLVATAPCDAPFGPADLVARLGAALAGAPIAVAEGPRGLEPLFALWRVDLTASLVDSIARGERSPRGFMEMRGATRVRFAAGREGDPFANLNSPADLDLARTRRPPN
jgi:molybdopterin-guanine dinucleotide biosynthesis protein A